MPLPPPDKLRTLAGIVTSNLPSTLNFEPFDATKAKIEKYAKAAAVAAVQSGLQTGLTMASGATVFTVGVGIGSVALFPLGAALGPWLAALAIGSKADGIFALHDLKVSAARKGEVNYTCSCGNCVKNLTYVIDRKENNVAIIAVGVFTAGIAIIADRLNSIRKSFQKNRPKEQICRSFIEGARGGCICAIASIMTICGKWGEDWVENRKLGTEAVAIICSSNGHERLKSKW